MRARSGATYGARRRGVAMRKESVCPFIVSCFILMILSGVAAFAEGRASINARQIAAADESSSVSIDLNRFEKNINSFEEADRKNPPPKHGTVFVGSSTFTMWASLENEFKQFRAINRGFGGSTLPDINHYIDRIVTKYNPSRVVLYAGTNDIAELKHSGREVLADFKNFVSLIRAKNPRAQIYFVSMSMAPSRIKWAKEYDAGNEQIRSFIKTEPYLHYINVIPVMRNKDGLLRSDLFGEDRLHMNPKGYSLWSPIISRALQVN